MKNTIYYGLAALIASPNISALEISDFKSGLVCTSSSTKKVCQETENIYIKGDDKCIFNNTETPCTWFGYSFEYSGAKSSDKIKCAVSTTYPVSSGDPEKIKSRNTSLVNYEFKVTKGNGVFFNPQYAAHQYMDKQRRINQSVTKCTVNNKPAFEFVANLIYPVN